MVEFNIDLSKVGRIFQAGGFRVGDNGYRTLCFHLSQGAEPFSVPENSIATIYAILPDGRCVYDTCTAMGDKIFYRLKGSAEGCSITSVPGLCLCEIRITSANGDLLTCPKFTLMVEGVLQDDGAIEAQDEFSALTEALIRVLDAESGLSARIEKVTDAVPGNVPVFNEGGAIADSGTPATVPYVFFFDALGTREYDEANKQSFESLIAAVEEGKHISVYIDYDGTLLPGAFDNGDAVASIFPNGNGYVSIRKMTNRIVYSEKDNYSGSFSETGTIPASQKATAEWVKALIETSITEGAW